MVDSPLYACQLVFVVNEAAVLNARSGATLPNACGFHGSTRCRRSRTYSASIDTALKSSMAIAYSVHRISRVWSTPVMR